MGCDGVKDSLGGDSRPIAFGIAPRALATPPPFLPGHPLRASLRFLASPSRIERDVLVVWTVMGEIGMMVVI